jgi:hypothetical protein
VVGDEFVNKVVRIFGFERYKRGGGYGRLKEVSG